MSSDKNKVVLKKIKDSTHILHPDSKLVLQSSKERIVIGRYVDNEILPLNDESIELCDKWNFKYDKTFLKSDEEEEDEEEAQEDEDEDEDEAEEENNEEEIKKEEVNKEEVNKEEVNKEEVKKEEAKKEEVRIEDNNVEPLLIKFGDDMNKLYLELLKSSSVFEQLYLTKIEDLESKFKNKDNELSELQVKYNDLTMQHDELKIQHDKLREKFKKMMSEFMENV